MAEKDKPLLTSNYELQGNGITRQIYHWVRTKIHIMGHYDNGIGIKNLVILWVLHKLARPLFFLHIWFNNQYQLKARIKRLIGRH